MFKFANCKRLPEDIHLILSVSYISIQLHPMGVSIRVSPAIIHIFYWDVPWNKPSSYWDIPLTMETTNFEQWQQNPSVIPLSPGWFSLGFPELGLLESPMTIG